MLLQFKQPKKELSTYNSLLFINIMLLQFQQPRKELSATVKYCISTMNSNNCNLMQPKKQSPATKKEMQKAYL